MKSKCIKQKTMEYGTSVHQITGYKKFYLDEVLRFDNCIAMPISTLFNVHVIELRKNNFKFLGAPVYSSAPDNGNGTKQE
jgi:hypothetical protein